MAIPLILGAARLFTVTSRAIPFVARFGKFILKMPGVGRISAFIATRARAIAGPLGKFMPWLKAALPWLFIDKLSDFLLILMEKVTRGAEAVWHYDWGKSDAQLMAEMKSAVTGLYSPLGETLGRSIASIIVGRGLGGGAGVPKVRINCAQMASLIEVTGGSESVRETLIDAVTDLWWSVKGAAQAIIIRFLHINGRKFLEKQTGKSLSQTEPQSFIFAEKFEEKIQKIFPDQNVSQAVIDGFEAFFDTLGDLLTEEDTYAQFI